MPWIRPGVVVHGPGVDADALLADFAAALRGRGFAVRGFVRAGPRHGSGVPALVDLTSGEVIPPEQEDEQAASFAQHLRQGTLSADLVVFSRFSFFRRVSERVGLDLAGREHGERLPMPVLTSMAGRCVHRWQEHMGLSGAMLTPEMAALWRWWGTDRLYRDLALGVSADEVRRITVGPRWLMVEGPAGAGLAFLPRGFAGVAERLAQYRQRSLRQLAALSESWDMSEAALGVAAINAHYNRYDLDGSMGTGVETLAGEGGAVVVVGAFPGMAEILPRRQVIEAEPRSGEFPISALETLLPGCRAAVVASSNLVDRKLPRILRLAQGGKVALTGPVTPMSSRLFPYGVHLLGGLLVRDPAGLARAVAAGMPPRGFGRFGQYMHIRRPGESAAPVAAAAEVVAYGRNHP